MYTYIKLCTHEASTQQSYTYFECKLLIWHLPQQRAKLKIEKKPNNTRSPPAFVCPAVHFAFHFSAGKRASRAANQNYALPMNNIQQDCYFGPLTIHSVKLYLAQ